MGDAAEQQAKRWEPQPGPQTAFARTPADLAFFGGQAGGGKSWVLLYDTVKWTRHPRVRGYRGILLRRTSPELVGGGGLWDVSQEMFRAFGGRPRSSPNLDWVFEAESGRFTDRHRIEFRHLVREDSVYEHQGRQYAVIGFDEITHFSERQFWYMVSRLRSSCGVRPYARATCNPDADSWVYPLISWWIGPDGFAIPERSGVLRWLVRVGDEIHWYDTEEEATAALRPGPVPKGEEPPRPLSFTFIASRLEDNPALTQVDPGYRSRLMALGRIERARLLEGNWKVREAAGMFFRRDEFQLADEPPSRPIVSVRAWDKAATKPMPRNPDPDWTRGVRMSLCAGGEVWIDHVESVRAGPVDVLKLMRATAEDDGPRTTIALWQDTGGAGVVDLEVSKAALSGFPVEVVESWSADTLGMPMGHRSSRAKRAFARVWAPWVQRGRVYVKRGEAWTPELLAEADGFPDARHDDFIDAVSLGAQVLARAMVGEVEVLTGRDLEVPKKKGPLSKGRRGEPKRWSY